MRYLVVTLLVAAAAVGYGIHVHRAQFATIDLEGRRLSAVVDLDHFSPLYPDMRRSEIQAAMGQPDRMYTAYVELDKSDDIEYEEICWEYAVDRGILIYYVEEFDEPGGSVQLLPERLRAEDFFRIALSGSPRIVSVENGEDILLVVDLASSGDVESITWFRRPTLVNNGN